MATLPNPLPRLAADPSGRSLGLELPLGRLVHETDDGPWHEPLLWHGTYAASPGAWTALGGAPAARVGLLPVLIEVGDGQGGPEDWELIPGEVSYPGDHDAEEVLAEYWEEYTEDEWPGLAPARALTAGSDARAAEVADSLVADGSRLKDPRLALVPARRSADIPAAIGWSGPLNHENDVARLCAVLRSWEDRFGIRVVALTFDRLVLSVAAPPTTVEEAEAVAVEHSAFCPDSVPQGSREALRAYAESTVLGRREWGFRWD